MTLKEVLARGYAKEIYEYALDNPYRNVELLTDALIKSKRMPEIYNRYYEDFISQDECLSYYYLNFAYNIDGANINKLCNAVIEEKDPYYCYLFAKDISGVDKKALEKVVCDSWDDKTKYLYARDIEDANIHELESDLYKSSVIIDFARDIQGADINLLQEKLIEDDEYHISDVHRMVVEVDGANKALLTKAFCNHCYTITGICFYYIELLEIINNEEELKIVKDILLNRAVKLIENKDWYADDYGIIDFANCLEPADIDKIIDAINLFISKIVSNDKLYNTCNEILDELYKSKDKSLTKTKKY